MAERLDLEVPRRLGDARLDRVLEELVPGVSRARWQRVVRRGGVLLGGRRVGRSNVRVRAGERLRVDLALAERPAEEARPPAPRVLFADPHLLVVDKPAGLLTHPLEGESASVALWAAREHGPLALGAGEDRPGIVHRLDRDTTGVLVLARTEQAMGALQGRFRSRAVEKEYLAVVHGAPPGTAGSVELALEPVPGSKDRQRVARDGAGKDARTDWELVERLGPVSLLRCRPHTGRRHQIRVHLLALGLPIVGDPLYGDARTRPLPAGVPVPRRQALHARRIDFEHPATGERVAFEAPVPGDLARVVVAARSLG